jgi:hypothetical protein
MFLFDDQNIKERSKMFNEEQKNKYLDAISDNGDKYIVGVKSLFNNLAAIEKEADVDFCKFDKDMVINALAQISGRKKSTKSWNLTVLKDYLDWCIMNGFTDQNELVGVSYSDIDTSKSIRYETIPNIEYLRRIIEVGFPEINDNDVSMNTIYRLYALLLYSGMTEQAKVDDNSLLRYNGKEINIHPFAKKYLDRVIATDEIVWVRFGKETYTKLLPSGKLIGCVRALENRLGNFKNMITKLNKLYQHETGKYIRLSTSRIYESGVYYRLLQKELDTGKIDEDIIKEGFDIREEKYSTQVIYASQMYNIKCDYQEWKKAWNYE